MAVADAMVTGRMPAGKKKAGNDVLNSLGLTASQAIGELYDYLIAHKEMPSRTQPTDDSPRLQEALAHVDSFPFVSLDSDYSSMDARAARMDRLNHRYDINANDARRQAI